MALPAENLWTEFGSAPLPVLGVTPREELIFANPLFEEICGWSARELVGLEPPFPFWTSDRPQIQLDALLRGDLARLRVECISMQFRHRNGHEIQALVTSRPLGDPRHPRAWILFLHTSEFSRAADLSETTWLHARIHRLEQALAKVWSALDSSALSLPRKESPAPGTSHRSAPPVSLAANPYGLSRRELEVLAVFRRSDGAHEIGKRLFISDHTVRNHLKSVYRKLGIRSKAQLMRRVTSDLAPLLPTQRATAEEAPGA